MKAKIITLDNKPAGEIALDKEVFGSEVRQDIIRRVINWQLAKRQAGTHSSKPIGEVNGTTAKPFRQKGTGNARQGNKKSPHMRGGAVAMGPVVRSHAHSLPRKVRKLGLKSALSAKFSEGKLIVVKDTKIKNAKTKEVANSLKEIGAVSALFIDGIAVDENFKKSISNIKNVDALPQIGANVYDIVRRDTLVLTEEAVAKLQERLKDE